jgi:hypothetical protein
VLPVAASDRDNDVQDAVARHASGRPHLDAISRHALTAAPPPLPSSPNQASRATATTRTRPAVNARQPRTPYGSRSAGPRRTVMRSPN